MKRNLLIILAGLLLVSSSAFAAKQTITSTDTGAQSRTKLNSNFTELYSLAIAAPWLAQATAPSITNVFWVDTSGTSPVIKYWDGDSWEVAASGGDGTYTLPTASADTLGGVKVGARLTITDGVLSADVQTGEGSMVYPSAGVPVSTGSAWGTSLAASSLLVGDCTVGPCLDGTSDGGNIIKLYAGTGSYWTALQGGAPAANRSWRLPIAAPPSAGTTYLMNMDEYGQMGFIATNTYLTPSGSGASLTVDASGFDGNLATTDNTLQEIAQKFDDIVVGGSAVTDATISTTDVTTNDATTTKHGWMPKSVAPASGMINFYGIANGETAPTNKALFDATAPSTQAYGDSAAVGSATVSARRDHKHAMPAALTDATISTTDVTTSNASTTKHGWLIKATAPGAGLRNLVAVDNGETVYKNAALFDATSPSTQASGDSAVVGTAMTAARRDHKHAMPTIPTASDTAYDATSWNGNTDVPTKNAVRDKIETLGTAFDPASPGAIGGTTPAAGTFTTITASSYSSSAADGSRYSTLPNNTSAPAAATVVNGFYTYNNALYAVENSGTASGVLTNAKIDTSSELRTLVTDKSGIGALLFAGGDIAAGTATTPSANDNDTSIATTAYVQTEVGAVASDSMTLTNKTLDTAGTGNSITVPLNGVLDGAITDPADADDMIYKKVQNAMTLTDIHCLAEGGGSITLTLQECSTAGGSCANIEGAITCDADGAEDDGTLTDGAIAAGAWIKVLYSAPTGTVSNVAWTVYGTQTW